MATDMVQPDNDLARALFEERAKKVQWRHSPTWAWKYVVERRFCVQRAFWMDEEERQLLPTTAVFDAVEGERVVIPMQWS